MRFIWNLLMILLLQSPSNLSINLKRQPSKTFQILFTLELNMSCLKLTAKYISNWRWLINMLSLTWWKWTSRRLNWCSLIPAHPLISYPIDDHRLEVVEEKRILGLIIRSDLKWSSNTKSIMARAYSKLWIIRRLKYLGAEGQDLVDIFCKHNFCLVCDNIIIKQTNCKIYMHYTVQVHCTRYHLDQSSFS